MQVTEDDGRAEIDAQIVAVAEDLVAGRLSPLAASERIWTLSLDAAWYGHELDAFIYAASEWHEPRVTSEMHEQWSSAVIETARELLNGARSRQRT